MKQEAICTDDELSHLAVVLANRLRQDGFFIAANHNQLCTSGWIFELSREETRIRQNKGLILIPADLGKENIFGIIQIILKMDPMNQPSVRAAAFVRRLGIQTHLKGYHYLITAICLGIEDPSLLDSLRTRLFPAVAERYGVRAHCVERNIRTALELAYQYTPEQLQAAFHYKAGRPYVSEVIKLAVELLQTDGKTRSLI